MQSRCEFFAFLLLALACLTEGFSTIPRYPLSKVSPEQYRKRDLSHPGNVPRDILDIPSLYKRTINGESLAQAIRSLGSKSKKPPRGQRHDKGYRFLSKAKNPQGGEHAHDGLNVGDVHAVSYHKPAKGMFSPVKNKLMVGTIQETAKGRTWVPSSHYFRGENRESKVKNSKKGKIPNDRPGSGYKIEYKGPVPQNTRPGHVATGLAEDPEVRKANFPDRLYHALQSPPGHRTDSGRITS